MRHRIGTERSQDGTDAAPRGTENPSSGADPRTRVRAHATRARMSRARSGVPPGIAACFEGQTIGSRDRLR